MSGRRPEGDPGRAPGWDERISPAAARAILDERARELARPPERPAAGDRVEMVSFTVAGETYGIEARYVFATVRLQHVASLESPGEPLVGLIAWRGELLPLLDLSVMTGAVSRAPGAHAYAVVLGEELTAFGIVADAVDGLVSLSPGDIRGVPGLSRPYVRGVSSHALLVLDGRELIRSYT